MIKCYRTRNVDRLSWFKDVIAESTSFLSYEYAKNPNYEPCWSIDYIRPYSLLFHRGKDGGYVFNYGDDLIEVEAELFERVEQLAAEKGVPVVLVTDE